MHTNAAIDGHNGSVQHEMVLQATSATDVGLIQVKTT